MTSYCRITGRSRGLPKPNYFPLLPPISPADAKRFCRITGKAYGLPSHHYIPVLIGKPRNRKNSKPHIILPGYKYYFPCLNDEPDLQEILESKSVNNNAQYIYTVKQKSCGIIFNSKLEAAVRDGDIRDVMVMPDKDFVVLKLKKKTIEVEMKEIITDNLSDELFEGEGVHKENNTGLIRKIFEEKEEQEDKKKAQKVKKIRNWDNVENTSLKMPEVSFQNWTWNSFGSSSGVPVSGSIPKPICVPPINLELSQSNPGLIQHPHLSDEFIGLELAQVIAPFKPLIIQSDPKIQEILKSLSIESLEKTFVKNSLSNLSELPKIVELLQIPDILFSGASACRKDSSGCEIEGYVVNFNGSEKFIIGQIFYIEGKVQFIPGQTIKNSSGMTFVPGFVVQDKNDIKFIPGQIFNVSNKKTFVAGMTTLTNSGEKFVPGQIIKTSDGKKFVPGQTVCVKNQLKFVPGQILTERFLPGQTITTSGSSHFEPGQTISCNNVTEFISGQSIWTEKGWEFVPGKTVITDGIKKFIPGKDSPTGFLPGQYLKEGEEIIFIPGITSEDENPKFIAGMNIKTPDGVKFVQGQITENHSILKFTPGCTKQVENLIEFNVAKSTDDLLFKESPIFENEHLKMKENVYSDGVFGHVVHSKFGTDFFPGPASGLPAGSVVPGKLFRGEKFVPGKIIEGEFVPGQFVTTDSGQVFIPGQIIEISGNTKFVPGQIIKYKGISKFVPGQTMMTSEGPKFVPGQIIETKSGPTFIPGQIIHTEEKGSKFVPGEVVETSEGPRFVPGRVIDTGDCVTFVPGKVVETSEGPKFVAPDLVECDDDQEFSVQTYEICSEELSLLHPKNNIVSDNSWEIKIDSKMLKQLSEAGMALGRQVSIEIPAVDVETPPALTFAMKFSKQRNLDLVTTLKLTEILTTMLQLRKLEKITGPSEFCISLNGILKNILHCNNDEECYNIIAEIIDKEFAINIVQNVDNLHSYLTSKESPLKKLSNLNILKEIINTPMNSSEILQKLNIIFKGEEDSLISALRKLSESEPNVVHSIIKQVSETIESIDNEKEVVDTLRKSIVAVVRDASQMSIVDLFENPECLGIEKLLLEAVGLAKALDMHETVSSLMKMLSSPNYKNVLAGDRVSLEILHKLTVMRKLAAEKPEFLEALKKLNVNPGEARTNPLLRQLLKESCALLIIPQNNISVGSIPMSLLFSQNALAMEHFLSQTNRVNKIMVILKNGIEAIIPPEAAHDVLTGSVPFTVLDEKGLRYLQPKHVFTALKLPDNTRHWFSLYKTGNWETPKRINESD